MYSCHRVFTDQFIFETVWPEFRISFKSHKPVSKTYRPKKDNLFVLMALRFPLWYLMISNAFIDEAEIFHFRGKNCPKMCLKITQSVKTPWHRCGMEVDRSGLWDPAHAHVLCLVMQSSSFGRSVKEERCAQPRPQDFTLRKKGGKWEKSQRRGCAARRARR